jgi:hypothetical protein
MNIETLLMQLDSSKGIARIVVNYARISRVQQPRTIENGAPPCKTVERGEWEAVVDGGRRSCSVIKDNSNARRCCVDIVVLARLDAVGQIKSDNRSKSCAGEDCAALDLVIFGGAVAVV